MRRVLAVAAALTIGGCGTGPLGPADANPPTVGDVRPVSHPDPVLIEYTASPAMVKPGERSVLQWRGEGFGTVQLVDGPFTYFLPLAAGSQVVEPTETTTYTLSTHGLHGEGHAYQLTVEVRP